MGKIAALIQFLPGKIKRAEVQQNDDELMTAINTAVFTDEPVVIGVQHTISTPNPEPPFALGEKQQGQKVVGLNADKLDGLDSTDFASSGHLHDTRYYTQAQVDAQHAANTAATDTKINNLAAATSPIGHTHATLPTANEKAALAGVGGAPTGANPFVTNGDARLTNARAPTAHNHDASAITSGTIPVTRGGTGLAALGAALGILRVNAAGTALEWGPPVVPEILVGQSGHRNADQKLTADGSWQTIILNASSWGKDFYNLATGVATVPTAGLFLLQFMARRPLGAGSLPGVRLTVDGAPIVTTSFDSDLAAGGIWTGRLLAGQQIRLQAKDNTSGETISGGGDRCFLNIIRLGSI